MRCMASSCSRPGCSDPHYGKGLCNRHYQRWRRHGDPDIAQHDHSPVTERLLKRVDVDDETGCWIWTGRIEGWGYGAIDARGRTYGAHRLSYETFVGPIPEGMIVCHACDRPPCINPAHLWLGTHADNASDRDNKGRQIAPRGEDHGNAVLTEPDIAAIRSAHAGGESMTSLAKRYSVTRQNIGFIVRRATWRHVS